MKKTVLSNNEIHIWHARLDAKTMEIADLCFYLSTDEKKRAAEYSLENPRIYFIQTRVILRHILSQYTHQAPEALKIGYSAHGKPYLMDVAIQFNLSHTQDYMLCAVSFTKVGIDIERIRTDIPVDALIHRFFSAYECDYFDSLSEAQRLPAFFRLWTSKEAVVKMLDQPLMTALKKFDIDVRTEPSRVVNKRADMKSECVLCLHTVPVPTAYVATCAVPSEHYALRSHYFESIHSIINQGNT